MEACLLSLILNLAAGLMVLLPLSGCSSRFANPPPTAVKVDLPCYLGRWYEIARLPMPFQSTRESARAEYGLNPDGTLSVHNIATRTDGREHGIQGTAAILDAPRGSKLAVRFNTWFAHFIPVPKEGNYWILAVDKEYRNAIVGTSDRKYLWILARTPEIPDSEFNALTNKAKSLGYDLTHLIRDPSNR